MKSKTVLPSAKITVAPISEENKNILEKRLKILTLFLSLSAFVIAVYVDVDNVLKWKQLNEGRLVMSDVNFDTTIRGVEGSETANRIESSGWEVSRSKDPKDLTKRYVDCMVSIRFWDRKNKRVVRPSQFLFEVDKALIERDRIADKLGVKASDVELWPTRVVSAAFKNAGKLPVYDVESWNILYLHLPGGWSIPPDNSAQFNKEFRDYVEPEQQYTEYSYFMLPITMTLPDRLLLEWHVKFTDSSGKQNEKTFFRYYQTGDGLDWHSISPANCDKIRSESVNGERGILIANHIAE